MWLKNVVFELAVTLVIALAVLFDLTWARWFVIVYTPLMVLLKLLPLLGSGLFPALKADKNIPGWFWHTNYAANVALLVVDAWWLPAAGWAAIWALSIVAERRSRMPATKLKRNVRR